jgi:hypothetical protein
MAGQARDIMMMLVGVTGRAARHRLLRHVRLMAARACRMTARRRCCLGRMTRRARCGALRIVRRAGMTTRARGMTGARGRLRLVGVTRGARGCRRRRCVRRSRVTTRALGVTRALRELHLVGVALRAHRDHHRWLAGMVGVAVEALRGRVTLLGVARRARERLRAAQRRGMDRMAADAHRARARRRVAELNVVTARTRARRIRMRLMAIDAARVRGGSEHRLIAMTLDARLDLGGSELVRHVAAGALDVTGGDRRGLVRVTGRAAGIRGAIGLVHVMTIETATRAGVLRLLVGVALRARLRFEARRAMCVVAFSARLIMMSTDRVRGELRLVVTSHAVRRFDLVVDAEAVTALARRRVNSRMQRRRHAGVALRAQLRGWWCEARLAVARAARDLADVHLVPRARAHELVRRRHLLGGAITAAVTAHDHDHRDRDRPTHHGREPIV